MVLSGQEEAPFLKMVEVLGPGCNPCERELRDLVQPVDIEESSEAKAAEPEHARSFGALPGSFLG